MITCPVATTVSCSGLVPPVNIASVTTSDNCGGGVTVVHVGDVTSNQTCANRFTVTRTYSATDACGNTATCAQIITVNDLTPPSLTCPTAVAVSCANQVPAVNIGSVTGLSDNCGGTIIVTHVGDVTTNQTCANRFTLTRTYRASDVCGNSATCSQVITVFDNTAPSITCPANLTVSCAGDVPAVNTASVITSDNCGGSVTVTHISDTKSNQTCENRFTVTRIYRATDVCGNSRTCSQIITVFDNIRPVLLGVPSNVTVECFIIPPPATPTATDNCGGVVTIAFNQVQTPGICPVLYTLTRTWTATDICGNSTSLQQIVTVIDTYAPQFLKEPKAKVVECNLGTNLEEYQAWLDDHAGGVVEDCSEVTWTYMDSPGHICPSACGGTFQHYIRFIATDKCGNSSYRDALFSVVDETPPTFLVEPQSVVVECEDGNDGEVYYYKWLDALAGLEVVDNCGEVSLDYLIWNYKDRCGGSWSRTLQFRARDECGNLSIRYATFLYDDNTPPEITCADGNVLLQCEFDIPEPDPSTVKAWDACSGVTVTLENIEVWGGSGCQSAMTKTYTYAATDECGNISYCYQSFMAVDSIAPVYTGPDTIEVQCIADLPNAEQAISLIRDFVVDACYDIICFNDGVGEAGTNAITFCFKAKDLCANWGQQFCVTFVAVGGCKPICSAGVANWGDPGSSIGGLLSKVVVSNLLNHYGPVTVGRGVRTVTVVDPECLFDLLPGTGEIAEFGIGNYSASLDNGCELSSDLMNEDGTLSNWVAAQTIALQLNIWYNKTYNGRQLDYQLLNTLPTCMIDEKVVAQLDPNATIKDLVQLSNNFLGSWGFYGPVFGEALATSLAKLNVYWDGCVEKNPCDGRVKRERDATSGVLNLELVPNPAVNSCTLFFESTREGIASLQISDGRGVFIQRKALIVKGSNRVEVNLNDLPAGVYYLTLMGDSQIGTLRLVKVKE